MDEVVNKIDAFLVLGIAVCCGVVSEVLSWVFVYRNEKFQMLNRELKVLYEKMQKEKEEGLIAKLSQKKGRKKISSKELYMQKTKEMNMLKAKSNVITGLIFMSMMPILFSLFEGVSVAILPFKPIFPFTLLTHSGLHEKSMYHCSSTFIYTIALMLTRQNIQKFLGYAPPGGMFGDFQMPDENENMWK